MLELTDPIIIAVVPALVEAAKRAGLPTRYAALAAVVAATLLSALRDLTLSSPSAVAASWLLSGLINGLAAAGLYSQARRLPNHLPAGRHKQSR